VFCCEEAVAFAVKIAVDTWFYSSVLRMKEDLGQVDGFPGMNVWFGLGLYHMLSAPNGSVSSGLVRLVAVLCCLLVSMGSAYPNLKTVR